MYAIASRRNRTATVLAAFAAALLFTAACDDSPTEPGGVAWAAQLESEALEGVVEVNARTSSFTATIDIANAAEGDVYAWQIAAGTCAEPGDRIGAADRYPELEIDVGGEAQGTANVNAGLDAEEDYIARVLDETGEEPVVLACAPLQIAE